MDVNQIENMAYNMSLAVKPMKNIIDLTGKAAIVTGGATGLGYAVVFRLAEAGAKVVIASRNDERGNKAVKEFKERGFDVSFVKCDVRLVDDCYTAVDSTIEKYGAVDILVITGERPEIPDNGNIGLGERQQMYWYH